MSFDLSSEEKKILLADARESITSQLEGRKPQYQREVSTSDDSALTELCGAFVTLHKGKDLRGCIGRMSASLPLEETVRAMAREAAFGDPRFPPLEDDELAQCHIEISAISPMKECPNPRKVIVGTHGLYLVRGGRSGVLLPQVPVEQGWNLDQYLNFICIKAGLPPDSCEAPDAKLYTFTAIVFGEE